MTGLVLHVGLSKTGTTTLQTGLFLRHPQIHYLGKHKTFRAKHGCRSDAIYRALAPAIWQTDEAFDHEASRAMIRDHVTAQAGKGQILLASWEALGLMRSTPRFSTILQRLTSIFDHLRVMVTIRNPYSLAPSLYLQALRGNFLKRSGRDFKSAYFSFEDWYRRSDSGRATSYGANIRAAAEYLGTPNLGIFLFEGLQTNASRYYGGICRFLGIEEGEGLKLVSGSHRNLRLTTAQVRFMQETQASWLRRMLWRHQSASACMRALEAAGQKSEGQEPARVTMTPDHLEAIRDRAAESNRWLVETFHLDLAKHGYPL